MALICRPRDYLHAHAQQLSALCKKAEQFRQSTSEQLHTHDMNWPKWCYLPSKYWMLLNASLKSTGVDDIFETKEERFRRLAQAGEFDDTYLLAALGTWRLTQGIYRFDPEVYQPILDTPVTGDIPCEILFRLPEWCIYVETPFFPSPFGSRFFGFWAQLNWDIPMKQAKLLLTFDEESENTLTEELILRSCSLEETFAKTIANQEEGRRVLYKNFSPIKQEHLVASRSVIEPALSLLLYLCSKNAEIGDGTSQPSNPMPKRIRKGSPKIFPPNQPTVWDVGVRLGAALRRAGARIASEGDSSHASPRAHIRRAHWHGFRSGPMKSSAGDHIPAETRPFELHWLPPIPINVEDFENLPATIHPVC
jgi:hypothetical protein